MKTYLIIVLFVAACLLAVSTPAIAHHGTGISYDLSKLVSVKGVVVKFALSNPHSQLYFDVTDDKGNVEHWSAEMNAPTNLERAGYSRRQMLNRWPGTPEGSRSEVARRHRGWKMGRRNFCCEHCSVSMKGHGSITSEIRTARTCISRNATIA